MIAEVNEPIAIAQQRVAPMSKANLIRNITPIIAFMPPHPDTEAAFVLTMAEAFEGTLKELKLEGEEPFKVRIPAGAKQGSRIRIKGKGRSNPMTGEKGDLYLNIDIAPIPFSNWTRI